MGKPALIQIVDDDLRNIRLLEAQLKAEGHEIMTALSGNACLAQLKDRLPDLILLDIMMPGMDGFEVAGRLKQDARTKAIPVIMVTALEDRDSRLRALHMGAEEFLNKPVDRAELWIRVRNMLRLKEYQNFLAEHNRILEEQVAERTQALRDAYKDTIFTMVRAAEFKDEETGAHVQRISFYCRDMAEELGMDAHFCDELFHASPMHDIGKIAIPDAVLLKPGGFSPEEWAIMKGHAAFGAKILERGGSPYTKMGAEIALNHHERWDGTGYPNGSRGEAIPFPARLMNIADVYDALRSKRPYKPAFTHERAVEIITVGDGRTQPGHFDPQVLDAFGRCAERWREIYETNAD
ncbi:MAG: two-component system response regulator [Rhodocyclales bacterium]|nr:MAG: two-component system response regulator [Rhodocyclales bacterium]